MGFLDKLFGRKTEEAAAPERTLEEIQAECPHSTVSGRWDSVEDMGKEDKATRFVCEACNAEFSLEEMRELRDNPRVRTDITG
jgi:hypothetical protein